MSAPDDHTFYMVDESKPLGVPTLTTASTDWQDSDVDRVCWGKDEEDKASPRYLHMKPIGDPR